jgi:hypothetical protein
MPGSPVTIGCSVLLTPGAAGPPDSGTLIVVPPGGPTAGGMPLAMVGSICLMINSLSGIPYPLPIGPLSPSQATVSGQPLVRMGDMIQSGPGLLTIIGPPAMPTLMDGTA